jgi:hydrophobic/amphiphilic exporter-1 (mainly G- bacteria), HAE1 family
MPLSALSIQRPVTTLMFYAGIVLVGIVCLRRLSVDFLPPVSIPRMTIHSACQDFSPEEMDDRVAQPLAAAAGSITGVKKTSTLCRRGIAVVTVEFSWGVNMDYAMLEVREKLDQLGSELPPGAERPTILRIDPSAEPVMTIGVTSLQVSTVPDSSKLMELAEACNALLKKRLEQVEGVAQVQVLGGMEGEIRVELNEGKLLLLGLTKDEVVQALHLENTSLPGGVIRSGSHRYPLRLIGGLNSADEIAQLSFTSRESGRRIRLSEIACVRDTIRERTGWTRYNGQDILVLQVRKEAGANTLDVSANVISAIEQLERENPGLRLHLLNDQAEFIRNSVADVQQSIFWGALLAFLVLFFFLKGLWDPLIVGITMPVSILATLVAMSVLGISLNVISLTGLALGIGMLGDNAIIVIENVRRLRDEGFSNDDAIVAGTREINIAVTASTMTNVAVFLPVLFVRSVAQQLFADMALTMTVSLLASLLVSVTFVPVLLSYEPRIRRRPIFPRSSFPKRCLLGIRRTASLMEAQGRHWVDTILCRVFTIRGWVLISTAAVFAGCVLLATVIPSEPAPEIDRRRFVIDVTMGAGTSASLLAEVANQIEHMLCRVPGASGVYVAGGIAASPDVWSLGDASHTHIHIEITVADSMRTAPAMEQAREGMRSLCRNLAGVEFTVKPGATTFERILRPQSSDVIIRIQGSDPAISKRIGGEFARQIQHLPGLADVSVPSRDEAPEYRVLIDRVAAERYGVTPREIAEYISLQTARTEATALSNVDRHIAMRVQSENSGRKNLQDLLASAMPCNGVAVPLNQLVTCNQALGCTEMRREDGSLTVSLTANAIGRTIGAVAADVRRMAAVCALPAGYGISVGGENEEMESSFRSLAVVIAFSLVLVYMILAAEYESLLYPFVILLTSPLAFIGAVLAMLLAGEKYNVMSLVGIVIMIGAVDNDAVIAVDTITALRKSGMRLHEAIRQGMRQRLRPILMTTATTVLGILPLILSLGEGSALVRALTIPLAGGLITSTLFTVVVIPIVYTYVDPWTAEKR